MFVLMDWLSRHSRRECRRFGSGDHDRESTSALSADSSLRNRTWRSILCSDGKLITLLIAVARSLRGLGREHDRGFWGGIWGGHFFEKAFPSNSLITLLVFALSVLCSCTIVSHSPYLAEKTRVPVLEDGCGLTTSELGHIPYQRWRIPPWDADLRYVWLVGNYDFRKYVGVELILYFHGTQPKDYYEVFRNELELLALKRAGRPFLFLGLVDKPHIGSDTDSPTRWDILVPKRGDRPEALFQVLNQVFKAFRTNFPNIKKDNTHIVLAGFSGGGKVLSAIGNWLARSDKEDPYAEVFRSRLSKIVYFDCWFDKDVIETIPALLEDNPAMKIVGTVHMKKPQEHASILADRFKMKADKKKRELMTPDGRLTIYQDDSHWQAMIRRLKEAL